jgi:hypothetical protein
MRQNKTSIDPLIKSIFILKNLGFIIVLLFIFTFCLENTYDRLYGDNNYKNRIQNLLKNGKTTIADFDENYVTNQIKIGNTYKNSFEFKYSFKVNDKTYSDVLKTEEFIPKSQERLIKYLTINYLPENPEVYQIDAELEYEYAKKKVEEHTIGKLLLNIFGLIISFFLILYLFLSINHKIRNFNKPIEKPFYEKKLFEENLNKTTDYSKFR